MAGRCTCSNWSLMMLQGWTDCLQCGNRILMGFGGVSQCSWLFLTILNRSAFLEASNSHRGALPLNSPGLIACRLLVNQFGYCIRTCLCSVFATKSSRANGDVRNIAQSWHKDTHTQQTSDGTWWYRLDTACLNSAAPQKTVREALVILEAKGLCQLALVGLHSQTYVNHVIVCYYVTFRWKTMGMRATQMDMAISGLWCTCSFTCVRIWFPLFWGMLWQLPSGKSHGTVRAMLPRELWQTVRPSFLWQVRHATIFRFLRSLSSPQTSPTLMCEWRWKLSKWNQTLSSMPVKRRG